MSNKVVHEIYFEYVQLVIGQFSNIIHDVELWYGTRLSLIANIKNDSVNHFNGPGCYLKYRNNNYPNTIVVKSKQVFFNINE